MVLKMVVPKGRMFDKVNDLLADAGIGLQGTARSYRPTTGDPNLEIKLLKSANIPALVALGQHDCGFAGLDWVEEQQAEVVKLLDLKFDPVKIVASIPESWDWEQVRRRRIIAVSEYRNLTSRWLESEGVSYTFLRSYGATEVFPPEDADLVVDNTSTGATLVENRLKIVGTLMSSSTYFIANPASMDDPERREQIENLLLLFTSVLNGRERVLLEMNCSETDLPGLIEILPCMKSPTIARLYGEEAFAVKAAVARGQVRELIPRLRKVGATDILEIPIRKVIP